MAYQKIIAGLGNPGRDYERTRHNIGFMLLDAFQLELAKTPWKEKLGAEISDAVPLSQGERLPQGSGWEQGNLALLVKPQEFMNRSGAAVQRLMAFYKLAANTLVVAHDDIDLPLGALRIKQGGGDGGHNGIKSIAASLSTKDFIRLRMGVGRPAGAPPGADVSGWVLGGFNTEEKLIVQQMLERGVQALKELCHFEMLKVQNRYN